MALRTSKTNIGFYFLTLCTMRHALCRSILTADPPAAEHPKPET
jgi:hypothetical protein